jgi:hypothetical protein
MESAPVMNKTGIALCNLHLPQARGHPRWLNRQSVAQRGLSVAEKPIAIHRCLFEREKWLTVSDHIAQVSRCGGR